jgi:hypothetical protein
VVSNTWVSRPHTALDKPLHEGLAQIVGQPVAPMPLPAGLSWCLPCRRAGAAAIAAGPPGRTREALDLTYRSPGATR